MRKIWSIILTVVLVVASVAAVPVSAAYVAADNITIATNVYDITCTVQTAVDGTMTAMLTNEAGDDLLGVSTNSEPTSNVTNAFGEVTGYKYVFTFRMEESDTTGTYKVRVALRNDSATKSFSYASLGDKISFYNTLNTKAAGEIKGYFGEVNPLHIPVDLTAYNAITDETVLGKVNAAIAALDLAVVPENDTTEAKLAAIAPVETAFTTAFAELMEVAAIVTTAEAAWPELVGTLQGAETFDKHYYDTEEVGVGAVTAAEVYDYFQIEEAAMSEYTVAEAAKAFDKATLALISDSRSAGIVKAAFAYFAEDLGIDMTNIGTLTNNTDFWNDVKGLVTANCDDLISKAETLAATGDYSGGGTQGGATGGVIIDRPTGGGAGGTLGNNTNKEDKPVAPVTPVTPAGSFSDIANVDWAKDAIEALAKEGVLAGKGDGKFYPNDSVTREEFVKIIVAAFDLADEDAACDFTDVAEDSWSYSYIAAASKLGIVSGDGANFNPKAGISRQDMAVIIHRVFEHLGLEVSGDTLYFDDNAAIAGYAKDAVDALTAAGIINGMGDGTFAPAGTVTRAQAAKVVFGLLDLVGGGK